MKKFLKKFPLTTYATIVLLIALNLDRNVQYDSENPIVLIILLIVFLSLPLTAINQAYLAFGIKSSVLPWIFPIFFLLLLDLLILSLRTGFLKNSMKKIYKNFLLKNPHNPKT